MAKHFQNIKFFIVSQMTSTSHDKLLNPNLNQQGESPQQEPIPAEKNINALTISALLIAIGAMGLYLSRVFLKLRPKVTHNRDEEFSDKHLYAFLLHLLLLCTSLVSISGVCCAFVTIAMCLGSTGTKLAGSQTVVFSKKSLDDYLKIDKALLLASIPFVLIPFLICLLGAIFCRMLFGLR